MKNLLLLGTGALVLASGSSLAADYEPAIIDPQTQFYLELGGGIGIYPATTWEFVDQDHNNEFKNGFVVRGAVGAYLPSNFRAEIEAAFRRNKADDAVLSLDGPFDLGGDVSSTSLMGNLIYDFDLGQVALFVGAGLGWAHLRFDTDFTGFAFTQADGTDNRFAYQLMAGGSFALTEQIDLVARYTFFDTLGDSVDMFNTGVGDTNIDAPYSNHSATIGLRFGF